MIRYTANWLTICISSTFIGALVGINVGLGGHSIAAAAAWAVVGGLAFLCFLLVLRKRREREKRGEP